MNRQPVRLLLVEDDPAYATTVKNVLADSDGAEFSITHSQTIQAAISQLAAGQTDLVLLDLNLPDGMGLNTFKRVYHASPATPIILLTGMDDKNLALTAVREGAQDYLVKGQIDGRMLVRVIQHAIERKIAAHALREREEFFRLITESVSDLIAVLDPDGLRIYNSPSYQPLLGEPSLLLGTDSFSDIHPEDREMVRATFRRTVKTGQGHRVAYRLLLKTGQVRYIESQGNAIKDAAGRTQKVVVISRDITQHKETVSALRDTLADLKKSHDELQATQLQLIQSEKLEAVSTFAAGVAHEVKNPLQAIILGVDYLNNHVARDSTEASVLGDMAAAVHRADSIIRGLVEFSANKKRQVRDEDLNHIIEQSLQSVEEELKGAPIALLKDVGRDLPLIALDFRTMKHVFINLFMYSIRGMARGGTLRVRTYARQVSEPCIVHGRVSNYVKVGDTVVIAEVEDTAIVRQEKATTGTSKGKDSTLGLTVLKKIVELYGGLFDLTISNGHKYTLTFKANQG